MNPCVATYDFMAVVSGPRKGGASNAVAWSVPHMPYTDEASDMIFHAPCMRCADYAAFHVASAAAIPNAVVSSYGHIYGRASIKHMSIMLSISYGTKLDTNAGIGALQAKNAT